MIKWSEFREGEDLYEAFLPEHNHESSAWLLRWSCNGHVIEERRIRMTWPPRFGPDQGDVAQIEAVLDALIASGSRPQLPESRGEYLPVPFSPLPSELAVLAGLAVLLAEYVDAERALGLIDDQTRTFLGLPDRAKADGFYPVAITPEREGRMRRVIALARLLERDSRAEPRRDDLITAVLAEDVQAIVGILAILGIDPQS